MTTSANNYSMNEPTGKELTDETHQVLLSTDISKQQPVLDSVQEEYEKAVRDLNNLKEKIAKQTNDYFSRVEPKNKYLGKNIQIGDKILYVTNNGVAKLYPNADVFNANAGNYGCPASSAVLKMDFPWSNDYSSPGAVLPTTPQLIIGTPMTKGQACGNEGANVYVNSLVNNPTSSYVGCYNNQAPSEDIMFVPKMTASNNANGFRVGSSGVYQNNNNFAGPWCAFDGNVNTWWHSMTVQDNPEHNYDPNTGKYKGWMNLTYPDKNNKTQYCWGEFLSVNFGSLEPIPLTKYSIQGRQGCCGDPNGRDPNSWYIFGFNTRKSTSWEYVDNRSNVSFNWQKKTFTVQDPKPYNNYLIMITSVGDPNSPVGLRDTVQIASWELYTSQTTNTSTPAMKNIGKMDFESCQTYSLNSGNQYFGLQSTDSNGVGNCMVSNDLAGSQMYGKANDFTMVPVWSTGTNNSGATTTLTNTGSLSVLNSASSSVYATSNPSSAGGYVGCYGDTYDRAMDYTVSNTGAVGNPNGPYDWSMTVDKCRTTAINNKYDYYAIQAGSVCFLSNNINKTMKHGKSGNCGGSGNNITGGCWANAVYSVKQTGNYFLILQDDGNLVIYKGTGPTDQQDGVWSTGTNGKQRDSNPSFTAAKGKYGKNWMPMGSSLAPNEFIGSNKGDMALIMQTDGNLVLYTFTANISCKPMSNGKTSGADGINALYQLKDIGVPSNVGNLGYVDENDMLHPYPSSNSENGAGYSKFGSTNIGGNDINTVSGTVQQCQTACDNNPKCTGFVYVAGTTGYLKSATSYSSKFPSAGTDIYVKNKIPKNLPIGVDSTTNNIDSITYQKYMNGGPPANQYGLANATSVQQNQLNQLQQRVSMLSNQMTNNNNKLSTDTSTVTNQTDKNMSGLSNYVSNLVDTKQQIKEGFGNKRKNNIDNLLTDSDITVLQQNYDYLFWSILATGTVLVSMSVLK